MILASECLFLGVVNIVLPSLRVEDRNELYPWFNEPLTLSIMGLGNFVSRFMVIFITTSSIHGSQMLIKSESWIKNEIEKKLRQYRSEGNELSLDPFLPAHCGFPKVRLSWRLQRFSGTDSDASRPVHSTPLCSFPSKDERQHHDLCTHNRRKRRCFNTGDHDRARHSSQFYHQ